MEWLIDGIRILFGLWMLINGLNQFFKFFPLPPLNKEAQAFADQLDVSGLMNFAKVIEVVAGLLLLSGFGVPAAITISMPVSMIVLFNNVVLVRGAVGYISGPLLLAGNVVLLVAYSGYFLPLLTLHSHATGWQALLQWQADWPVSSR